MKTFSHLTRVGFFVVLIVLVNTVCFANTRDEALALMKEKKYGEAEAILNRLIADKPNQAQLHDDRAGARIGLRNFAGADADYGEAIRIEPDNISHRSNRADLRLYFLKDYTGAIIDYTELLRVKPDEGHYLYMRGRALQKAGYLPEALVDLDRAVAVGNASTSVLSARGVVLEQLGRRQEAETAYRKALEINAKNLEASRGLQSLAAGGKPAPPPTPATPLSALLKKAPEPAPPSQQELLKKRVFRLVKIEMPLEDRKNNYGDGVSVSYEGKGLSAGFKFKRDLVGHIRWVLPSEIVPGKPAKISMEGIPGGGYPFSWGYVSLSGPYSVSGPIVGVRVTQNEYMGQDVLRDAFDLVLPDISHAPEDFKADKGDRDTLIRLRNRKALSDIIRFTVGNSKQTPAEVSVEEYRVPLKDWLRGDKNHKEIKDIQLVVYYSDSRWPVARYTYRSSETILEGIEFAVEPAGPASIIPDGRDGIYLKARAVPRADGRPVSPEATRNIVFTAEGVGKDWADLSETQVRDGWQVVFVKASNPDAARGSYRPPEHLLVSAQSTDNDIAIGGLFRLGLSSQPVIDADPDKIEFTAKSGQAVPVKVWISSAGASPWTFRTLYKDKDRALARVSLIPTGNNTADLTLTEAGLDPVAGASGETAVLRVLAEQAGREPLERHIKIIMGQEGVFATTVGRDPEGGFYRVAADGKDTPTDVDFRVFVFDAEKKLLVNRPEAVKQLKIESLEPETSLAAQVIKLGQLKWSYASVRAGNDPTGIIRFSMPKEIPGDGRIIRADFKATFPGRTEENFTAIFSLGFVTTTNGPGSKEWAVEVGRCEEIIRKFVPPAYHVKMYGMLEKRKHTLGVEGVRALRERIWQSAVLLTLGDGGEGYANEAAWADTIAITLEWAEWAGDLAFNAVIGSATGPHGALGASMLKSAIISAINAYQDGQSPDAWLWDNLCTLPGMMEGRLIDPDAFQRMGANNRAKAWALYVAYHFCKNLYNGASVVDALKNTSREIGNEVLAGWLNDQVRNSAGSAQTARTGGVDGSQKPADASGPKDAGDAKAQPPKSADGSGPQETATAKKPTDAADTVKTPAPPAAESDASRRIRSRMRVSGEKPYAESNDVLAVMRDPSMVRALKNASPEVQAAFSNTREAIYRQHDAEVVQHVKKSVPGMENRMVKVMEFRTPGQTGSNLNTDRDYRVCYYAGRDAHTGKERWIEVDRRQWENQSYQAFARATGGPADDPKAARHWAEEHQQLATDKYHAEASPDFSDQRKVWNPQTRKFESVQVTPDIVRVKSGQAGASLKDPQALGHMYQMKVGDARFNHEKYVQAQKAVKELDAIRSAYKDRAIGTLPESVRKGMDAVREVNQKLDQDPNRRDPKAIAEAEKALRANGFQDLNDFMNKLSSQFEFLKNAK